jgi:hypothetical protein
MPGLTEAERALIRERSIEQFGLPALVISTAPGVAGGQIMDPFKIRTGGSFSE